MKKFSFALLASFALFACSDNNVEEKDASLTVSDSSFKPVTPVSIADTLMSGADSVKAAPAVQVNNGTGGQAITIQDPTKPAATIQPTAAPVISKNAKGLNPAHGQPGHRCDIAVGAPLNSPVKTTPGVTQSAPQVVSTAPATITPAVKAAPGVKINPPHGQPGHDCSVSVGAPLKG